MKSGAGAADRRLRIALLVDRFGNRFGGAEAYGVELARVLSQRHDVTVLARDYDCDLVLPYQQVRVSARLPSWLRVLYFAWRAWRLTRGRYDIVHSHMNGWAGEVQVVHVMPARYNWITRHGSCAGRWTAWASPRKTAYLLLEKSRVRRVPGRRIVAVSDMIASQLHESYGSSLPLDIVLPGVGLPAAADPALRAATRARLGWDDGVVGCLLLALNPLRKGLPALLEALERLPGHYRLAVVGCDAVTRDLLASKRWQSLCGRVIMAEPTSDVAGYFRAADVYVHPTLSDSFGMAPLEAMSYGVPVVISSPEWCGFARYLTHGRDAVVLSDPRDAAGLCDAIARVGTDAALREMLGYHGRAVAAARSWEQVAGRYETLYTQVLAERNQ